MTPDERKAIAGTLTALSALAHHSATLTINGSHGPADLQQDIRAMRGQLTRLSRMVASADRLPGGYADA